jgi:hypothetical protein
MAVSSETGKFQAHTKRPAARKKRRPGSMGEGEGESVLQLSTLFRRARGLLAVAVTVGATVALSAGPAEAWHGDVGRISMRCASATTVTVTATIVSGPDTGQSRTITVPLGSSGQVVFASDFSVPYNTGGLVCSTPTPPPAPTPQPPTPAPQPPAPVPPAPTPPQTASAQTTVPAPAPVSNRRAPTTTARAPLTSSPVTAAAPAPGLPETGMPPGDS